jgi:prephenate dehydrogenase
MADVLVVGAGLIGASIGLALRQAGWDVVVEDASPPVVDEAVRRGAGRPWDRQESARLAVICVPPRLTAGVLNEIRGLEVAGTYTHEAYEQSQVMREVEA